MILQLASQPRVEALGNLRACVVESSWTEVGPMRTLLARNGPNGPNCSGCTFRAARVPLPAGGVHCLPSYLVQCDLPRSPEHQLFSEFHAA